MRASSSCPSVSDLTCLAPAGVSSLPRARAPAEGWGSLPRTPTTPSSPRLGVRAVAGGRQSLGLWGHRGPRPHHGATLWGATLCASSPQFPPSCVPAVCLWRAAVEDLDWGRTGCGGTVSFLYTWGASAGTGGLDHLVRCPPEWAPRPLFPGALAPLRPGWCARPTPKGVGSKARGGDLGRDRSLSLAPPLPGGDRDVVSSHTISGTCVGLEVGWGTSGVCRPRLLSSPLGQRHRVSPR